MLRLNFQVGDVSTLHPHLLEEHTRGRVIGKALFEGLTRINAKAEAELAGAELVDISSCQTHYTFTLREHQWSDGTAVTAFQYEKAWKQAIAPTSDCVRADLFYVIEGAKQAKEGKLSLDEVGIEALDHRTLSVKLAFPVPYFLKLISSPVFAPVERMEPYRFNGPFTVNSWKRDQWLALKANPYFWDHERVLLKEIDIQMVTDPSTVFLMYEKQELDWVGDPCCKFTSEIIIDLQKQKELQQQSTARVLWIYMNTQSPVLKSTKIRQALSLAIDRSLITKHIYPCNVPLYQPLPRTLSLCSHPLTDNNLVQSQQLFEEGLREMGYSKETFPPLILNYPNMAGRKQAAEYLQEVWEKAFDVKVRLKGSDWNSLCANLKEGEFQMGLCGAEALSPDPSELLERFESIQSANFPRWEHPLYREKLHLARTVFQKRTQFLSEAEDILLEEMPIIPICNFDSFFIHHPKLKGYVFDHAGCIDFRWAYFN